MNSLNYCLTLRGQNHQSMISKEENILLAAEELFATKGFNGTSTREIAKEARVNVSMISYYFGSKEKLFEQLFQFRMNESLAFSKEIMANDSLNEWEKLNVVITRYIFRVKTLKNFYLILQREQLTNKNPKILQNINESKKGFLRIYEQLIHSGFNDKIFTKKPRLELIHATISGTIFTGINTFSLYKEFSDGDDNFEIQYFEDLNIHIKNLLKYLLGYEQNI